ATTHRSPNTWRAATARSATSATRASPDERRDTAFARLDAAPGRVHGSALVAAAGDPRHGDRDIDARRRRVDPAVGHEGPTRHPRLARDGYPGPDREP